MSYQGKRFKTHHRAAAGGTQRVRVMPRRKNQAQGIPQGTPAVNNVRAKKQTNSENLERGAVRISGTAARSTWQRVEICQICQNIIGRTVAVGSRGWRGGGVVGGQDRTLALLDQPAREHGRGVFLEILIQQLSNFLAQISGVGQTREFVRLQSGARGGEQKFPGSLGAELRHEDLRSEVVGECTDINNRVLHSESSEKVNRLWKCVEKEEKPVRLCSSCPGDYEDPDWSAWDADPEEDEELGEGEGGEWTVDEG